MTLQEEPGSATWLEAPEATMLGIRRAFKEGGGEQWAIVVAGDGVTLRKAGDGNWADIHDYADIPAALAGQPELALLRPGRATWFDLADNAGIGDDELVRLLDPCAEEVSDEPGWADDVGWEDGQIWEWTSHLDFVRRLVCITDPGSEWNTRQVSWLDFHGIHPVIADEDGFVGERIASFSISFTGNSMVGYTGGSQLVLVAPGTAVSIPTGDAHEVGEFSAGCFPYPDEGNIEERAAVIADWLAYSDMYGAEVPVHLGLHAALQFEPFDPDGTPEEEGRQGLGIHIDFEGWIDVPVDLQDALRAALNVPGSEYAYVTEALREPGGPAARALLDANPVVFREGNWYETLAKEDGHA
jgi:hypothetical protein